MYGAWSGVLTQVLPYSESENGNFGAASTFASIGGSLLVGWITDFRFFYQRLQSTTLVVMALAAAFFLLFALHLSFAAVPSLDQRGWLLAVCTLAGAFRGAADPLFFELAAETAFPQPASTAGGVMTFLYHVTAVISLYVAATMPFSLTLGIPPSPHLLDKYANYPQLLFIPGVSYNFLLCFF